MKTLHLPSFWHSHHDASTLKKIRNAPFDTRVCSFFTGFIMFAIAIILLLMALEAY